MKKLLVIAIALLMSIAIMGSALAEYGYTTVSKIPQAVDFTFEVTFDDKGMPQVVTDYPYESTGATEMTLVYHNGEYEDISLSYDFARKTTNIGHSYYEGYNTIQGDEAAANAIKDGTVTLDDIIHIYTDYNSMTTTDWFLSYSISKKAYIEYEEKTNSQGYDGMGAGGERKLISYKNGKMDHSYYQKRASNGDLCITYSKEGKLLYADLYLYEGANKGFYDYNRATGHFSGKKLSELGYNDDDINTPAPAALGDKKDPNLINAFIARCYKNILSREATAEELKSWRQDLSSGSKTAADIVDQFAASKEFKGTKRSFADMVETLYLTMLDRSADPAEKADWIRKLQNGQRLKSVLNGITTSQEYINLCETCGLQPGVVKVPVIIK